MASCPSATGKRKDLSASEKVQVLEYKKENLSAGMRSIAEKFGCRKSQIQSILAKKDEILEHYGANKNAHCKGARLSQLKNVDEATYKWYQKARSKNIPVTVQNAAARLVSGSRKYDHVSPVLHQLHWLPVDKRII